MFLNEGVVIVLSGQCLSDVQSIWDWWTREIMASSYKKYFHTNMVINKNVVSMSLNKLSKQTNKAMIKFRDEKKRENKQ